MGTTLAIIGLIVGAASTVAQSVQARKAAKARREATAVSTAGENVRDKIARRRGAKEERLRRARLIQASTAGGTEGSSGEIGATSALGANFGAAVASQSMQRGVSQGITAANQKAADATSKGKMIGAWGDLAVEGLGMWDDHNTGKI